ncbi:hypothetical protein HAHE_15090 [Haloferula helveola]|uniref:Uncharacterized protein n=1 Tax=Haloferula helveola TaxID=490095 RepID=A0ABN6H234_9BACT|nr:hypothetical protein HAHE_15090 [Haloferula helveola]
MHLFSSLRARLVPLLAALGVTTFAAAAPSDLLFTVSLDSSTNRPTFTVTNNSPNLKIDRFDFTIGNTAYEFDWSDITLTDPPGGDAFMIPTPGSGLTDSFTVLLNDFDPGESFTIRIDIDNDGQNNVVYNRYVFFNNGGDLSNNSRATVWSGVIPSTRVLPDFAPPELVFRGPSRILNVASRAESQAGDGAFVRGVQVFHEGLLVSAEFDTLTVNAGHGDRVQIIAPQEVYKDIHSNFLGGSTADDPDLIKNDAEERFVALGMSVNNVAQTADPTNYDFEILGDTNVQVKWEHYYALTIEHDFAKTKSVEEIAGTPWAGPLASDAAGTPDPPVSKQWVLRGTEPVVQIDGALVDTFSHPGLDIRFVVEGYRAYGPPNTLLTQAQNAVRIDPNLDPDVAPDGVDIRESQNGTIGSFADGGGTATEVTTVGDHGLVTGNLIQISGTGYDPYNAIFSIIKIDDDTFSIPIDFVAGAGEPLAKGTWRNITYVKRFEFETVEQRQQVEKFNMYGPGGITYVWQIQYGIRINADDPTRIPLGRVYEVLPDGTLADSTVIDGVAWFDPGAHVKVVSATKDGAGDDALALTGWVNGDGYYFSAQGEIDPASGLPTSGSPALVNGGPVAAWITDGPGEFGSLGYEIPNLRRPVRVLWRYGAGAVVVNVTIGKHVFEDYPQYATMFLAEPDPIINAVPDPIAVVPDVAPPGAELMAEWDPVSGRLFPTVPGRFTVPWRPTPESANAVEVRVIATLPNDGLRKIRGHYPHIHGTPAVALDPDPGDDFLFKEIKYTTAGATVDDDGLFATERPGMSVLLFSQLQKVGRGEPKEFLQVRVVDTRAWNVDLDSVPKEVPVGTKISDPSSDRAGLGTGYLLDFAGRARYNPFIYDEGKLQGLAAIDIYDMDQLRADSSSLVVVNKGALPGPVIPVNEHPGVPDDELPIIVWYDDPRINDGLMWPWVSKIYEPVWPSAVNAPQIVIASQFGSEGLGRTGLEQVTAPAIGEVPEATTYDPSRLQAVQVYQQPDPDQPGYNPNEEHALMAPSLRFADVSPRPPAVYALRDGDINNSNPNVTTGSGAYTSDPFVLVQFFDVAADEVKMNIYTVKRQSSLGDQPFYRFADNFTATTTNLASQPYVVMNAGEPVIPFYPLGVAIGAAPPAETFGNNFFPQEVYWEDWRGTYWSISGGNKAWFNASFYYPLNPDFWWPSNLETPPVKVVKSGATYTPTFDSSRPVEVPSTGDAVAFLPSSVRSPASAAFLGAHLPTKVIFKSEWPDNPPVLKAGETLTFSGGENAADETFLGISDPAPGLPQLTAFASAEIIFDSLNPESDPDLLRTNWTGRVVNALVKRTASLSSGDFPPALEPATGRVTVKGGKYIFNELSASLQRRLRYDPIAGQFEFIGLLNDKDIGDNTLTAAPPQVYSLEPNILTVDEWREISALASDDSNWTSAATRLFIETRDPQLLAQYFFNARILEDLLGQHLAGLIPAGNLPEFDPIFSYFFEQTPRPLRAYGPGLAVIPNGAYLDPLGKLQDGSDFPDESYITVVENNDPSLGGSPITPHIIKVDRKKRYRGSIQVLLSDNVFDENIVLRSTGDFGANADDLVFEWWYRPDDGSVNVPPPDLIPPGQTNPWKLFPDPSGNGGKGRYQITLKGNPNAPETLLADSWWFVRYRHKNDSTSGTNWNVPQSDGKMGVNFTWAGAGNSQPLIDADLDGIKDFRAQLAQGWIKRVLDAVNPYEARIRDFEGDNPATVTSMITQFGARYEGPVALNPDKNVIENVGLIELYETVLNRGRSLSIDLSRPVSTPAIANALQLASTRISDFYTLLGNEAYGDALDPTIGHGSSSVDYGSLSTSVFTFQNQMASPIAEELSLLHGVDDFFARPVYNRLFWNFTKGEGEAAYATNYNINDINQDGFIDEDDAMILYPQGHGDAWGHYLMALRNQYELLRHPFFNWVSRSESYNLMDIVISVDFLDERKFAASAAAKAKAGAEIVALTYREKYVADPKAQWQGYTDSNPDRAWGVDEWSRRAGQGAYFDWVTSNALLPAEHPNTNLEGIQKVDRTTNSDISVVSANLAAVQRTIDQADRGYNPLGLAAGAQMFDLDPLFEYFGEYGDGTDGRQHFDQIYIRFLAMLENATTTWDWANQSNQMIRRIGNSELEFRNSTFQEDLSYRNRLIEIFGKPYEGTIGPGKLYPAGYEGPDLGLYMYVPIREINYDTVPRPATGFASFGSNGALSGGDLYDAYLASSPSGSGSSVLNKETALKDVDTGIRTLFNSTFANSTNSLEYDSDTVSGLFAVNYTDLDNPKVSLENFVNQMPITAAGYTFQAPAAWGGRGATGELQVLINQMIQQEAEIAKAVGAWDALTGETVRILRLINARLTTSGLNQGRDEIFSRVKLAVNDTIEVIETAVKVFKASRELTWELKEAIVEGVPVQLPTGGLAISPGDALSLARSGIEFTAVGTRAGLLTGENVLEIGKLIAKIGLDIAENELEIAKAQDSRELEIKEWIKELEDQVGDEPVLRIAIFKEIQALRELSDRYRTLLDEGGRLVDERAAFNKRVAAQTQLERYQDMTFRVSRNHALQTYRSSFDLAARYAYLATAAYDYETNFSIDDPAAASATYGKILKARSLGSLRRAMEQLKQNYDSVRSQIGFNNPQRETGEMSLRQELMRILPPTEVQPGTPANEYPSPGEDSDTVWQRVLEDSRVDDLWQVSEFRNQCRPFAAATDPTGKPVPQPGMVIRFSSDISSGKNFFGKPLSGGDQAYSTSNFATKISGVGVAFEGYQTDDVLNDLAAAPRIYFVPAGLDMMRVSRSDDPDEVRAWKIVEQAIPLPFPTSNGDIEVSGYIPLLDSLNGRLGDQRRFSDFRAYPEDLGDAVKDTRLVGRSVWNTEWILIIPGATLNADPDTGIDRFIDQVSDIKLVFDTYGQSGG